MSGKNILKVSHALVFTVIHVKNLAMIKSICVAVIHTAMGGVTHDVEAVGCGAVEREWHYTVKSLLARWCSIA